MPSHLNRSTPANTAVAVTLAVGGAVLIVVLGIFAVLAIRGRTDAAPSMRLALRAGFALLVAGLLAGAAMIAVGTTAMNTGTADHAYDVTGFLKHFHGVTLHAVLVLPALAWLLARTPWGRASSGPGGDGRGRRLPGRGGRRARGRPDDDPLVG